MYGIWNMKIGVTGSDLSFKLNLIIILIILIYVCRIKADIVLEITNNYNKIYKMKSSPQKNWNEPI